MGLGSRALIGEENAGLGEGELSGSSWSSQERIWSTQQHGREKILLENYLKKEKRHIEAVYIFRRESLSEEILKKK